MSKKKDDRLFWFLTVLAGAGGREYCTDNPKHSWLNTFCTDRPAEPDTFNLAHDLGFVHCSHDTSNDDGWVTLTDAGRAYIASPAPKGET